MEWNGMFGHPPSRDNLLTVCLQPQGRHAPDQRHYRLASADPSPALERLESSVTLISQSLQSLAHISATEHHPAINLSICDGRSKASMSSAPDFPYNPALLNPAVGSPSSGSGGGESFGELVNPLEVVRSNESRLVALHLLHYFPACDLGMSYLFQTVLHFPQLVRVV
jgi:hypothetical protein